MAEGADTVASWLAGWCRHVDLLRHKDRWPQHQRHQSLAGHDRPAGVSGTMRDAVERAVRLAIVVGVAAGNEGRFASDSAVAGGIPSSRNCPERLRSGRSVPPAPR